MLAKLESNLFLCIIVAVIFVALAGYIDLTTSEIQLPLLTISVFAAILGYLQPKFPWLWTIMIGGSIFIAYFIANLIGYKPPYEVQPNIFSTLLALFPALIGAYIGVIFKKPPKKIKK